MLARLLIVAVVTAGGAVEAAAPVTALSEADLQPLIEQLGDPDFAVRELASQRLADAGAAAADLLLAAAEESADLEVALRARWLAESIPFTTGRESPEAAALIASFAAGDLAARVGIMHRLLRLDDDAGIEPLARIVRLDRSAAGSRIAAALLVNDWEPGDPYWLRLAPRIRAGIGGSTRPTARFLRGLVAHATADSGPAATDAIAACENALNGLTSGGDVPIGGGWDDDGDGTTGTARAGAVFRRCLAVLLAGAGRRTEALATAAALFETGEATTVPERAAAELHWLASHGLPEAVDLVSARLTAEADPLLAYAAAIAWLERDAPEAAAKAEALADLAGRRLEERDLAERLTAAITLAHWGGSEWASREYRGILESPAARPAERVLAAISYGEFLHDQEQDAAAAEVMRAIVEAEGQAGEDLEQGLMQLGRDPRATRSRMLFFAACAESDEPARRRLIEESLRAYPDDVDTLIAAYRLAHDDPDQRVELGARIARTAAAIERQIRELPAESVSRNEYAWLIANTEGDLGKATRYSRESLELSFDTASYLDTLAHCHAAAGRIDEAVRTQWLAVKKEPHSLLIRRSFDRFRRLAGSQP